jgi:hypothetical protein
LGSSSVPFGDGSERVYSETGRWWLKTCTDPDTGQISS